MTAVVTLRPDEKGRHYRLPSADDYAAVRKAHKRVARLLEEWKDGGRQGHCPVPDEPLPLMSGTFNVPLYGITTWGGLFTARQKATLIELATARVPPTPTDSQSALEALRHLLALVVGRQGDYLSAQCVWHIPKQLVAHTFGRQALPFTWDYVEVAPFAGGPGNVEGATQWIAKVVMAQPKMNTGQVHQADATKHPLPDDAAGIWFTDPPYYFAIPYADLSDFFFVWLNRALPGHSLFRDPSDPVNPLTPKEAELCEMARWDSDRYAHKDKQFFENGMARAFAEGRRVLKGDGIGSVVFAHKTTEGWEALLSGMTRGGWTVTASWPLATEMGSRLRARDSAALATSIHLVCRPRPENAPVGDWADVLRELPVRVGNWMERLQGEGIRGADLVFACIGPALEIFSRFSRVETADGGEVGLPAYLEKVWEVVGRTALENVLGAAEAKARNGLAGALEEDARLTALFLWTLQTSSATDDKSGADAGRNSGDGDEQPTGVGAKGYSLAFDVARRFAQPLGIDLPKWEKRIVETKKGVVRLLPVSERAKGLFGESGSEPIAKALEQPGGPQQDLFADAAMHGGELAQIHGGSRSAAAPPGDRAAPGEGATTLDRVHTAMLLQAGGRTHALRNLVAAERERGPDFERLANALSALYPRGSEEKRLLDAMLLASPS